MSALRLWAFAVVALLVACTTPTGASSAADETSVDPVIARLIEQVNRHRRTAGLAPVVAERRLESAASRHSATMAKDGFISHDSPNGAGLADRLAAAGYPYGTAAENVAGGFRSPEAVVESWMASAGHRRNILHPDVSEAGVGYLFVDDPPADAFISYWTLILGTPRCRPC